MKRRLLSWILILPVLITLSTPAPAQEGQKVIDVWPGGKAHEDDASKIGPERQRFDMKLKDGSPYVIGGKPVKWITAVTQPTLTVFEPPADKKNGCAVIVCPGGGYWNLAWDLEGTEVAQWLNTLGVTGIVLKYRCPRREGDTQRPGIGALKDAQRAVSLVRSKADELGIDPHRIGMVGFSVGGNVVAVTSTTFDERRYQPLDDVDKVSSRPDFGICCYSGYLRVRDDSKDELDPSVKARKDAPPLFFVHATDDTVAKVDESVIGYLALKRAGAPVELHLYEKGEHGFGVRELGLPVSKWTAICADWMRFHEFLTPSSTATTSK